MKASGFAGPRSDDEMYEMERASNTTKLPKLPKNDTLPKPPKGDVLPKAPKGDAGPPPSYDDDEMEIDRASKTTKATKAPKGNKLPKGDKVPEIPNTKHWQIPKFLPNTNTFWNLLNNTNAKSYADILTIPIPLTILVLISVRCPSRQREMCFPRRQREMRDQNPHMMMMRWRSRGQARQPSYYAIMPKAY